MNMQHFFLPPKNWYRMCLINLILSIICIGGNISMIFFSCSLTNNFLWGNNIFVDFFYLQAQTKVHSKFIWQISHFLATLVRTLFFKQNLCKASSQSWVLQFQRLSVRRPLKKGTSSILWKVLLNFPATLLNSYYFSSKISLYHDKPFKDRLFGFKY